MGNFADFKEYGARAPGANEIANCPTHVHDPSRSLLNLRDDRHCPPHRRDDHLHQKTSPPFISEDRCRLSHPGNHGTLDRVSSGSCSLTRKQNCHPELPLPLLPQKHPLPALSLISAMPGIVLLVVGMISLSKTFSLRSSNDWRTPSHPRHHRTLDLREDLGCSLDHQIATVSILLPPLRQLILFWSETDFSPLYSQYHSGARQRRER